MASGTRSETELPSEVFVGRAEAAAVLAGAVRDYVSLVNNAGRTETGHNLFVFYGLAGRGKTALLQRLDPWLSGSRSPDGWMRPELGNPRVETLTFDVSSGLNVDHLLLALRERARRRRIETPAFDIAYLERWKQARPLEASPSELESTVRLAGRDAVPAIQASTKAALAAAGLGSLAESAAKAMGGPLWGRLSQRRRKRLSQDFPLLDRVVGDINSAPSELHADGLIHLFTSDITRADPEVRPAWIVFVDGFDPVRDTRRQVAQLLQQLVRNGSFALWVVASRTRLGWAGEQDGDLPYVGAEHWPALADAQHELAKLTGAQCHEYLERTLGGATRLVSSDDRKRLVTEADGSPLYLRLAAEEARRRERVGAPVEDGYLAVPLAQLVNRLLGDLPHDERRAINAAALTGSFDHHLIAASADVDESAVERLLRRGFIVDVGSPSLTQSLHQVVRNAARNAAVDSHGGQTPADRQRLGQRMLDELCLRYAELETVDERLAYLGAAFDVAAATALAPAWLLDAALKLAERGAVASVLAGRTPPDRRETWAHALDRFFACWEPGADFAERLQSLADDKAVPADIRRAALRFQAFRLRTIACHRDAERILGRLRAEPGGDDDRMRFQHALSLVHLGWFGYADTLRELIAATGKDTADAASRSDRLRGEIRLHHGHVAEAADAAGRRASYLAAHGYAWNAVEASVAEARHRSLLDPGAADLVEDVFALTERYGLGRHGRSALCSQALCCAGRESTAFAQLIARAQEIGRAAGEPEITVHELLAWSFDAAVRRDQPRTLELRALLDSEANLDDTRWSRQIRWWHADVLGEKPPQFAEAQWLEPEEDVQARWVKVVADRRVELGIAGTFVQDADEQSA